MKANAMIRAATISLALTILPPIAWGASAKDVFAEVANSVVVVLALDEKGAPVAQGSGVVVGDFEVVTNCHVLYGAAALAVRQAVHWHGRESYRMTASLMADNQERDLCLLFVKELPVPPRAKAARLGSAKVLSVGDEVYAIGAPAGLELSLSRGVVSQLRGAFGKRSSPLVQTDAAISPGSSGGGLFNEAGELVGITTFKYQGENLNFAMPVEWVEELRAQGQLAVGKATAREACAANPTHECVVELALHAAETARSAYPSDSHFLADLLLEIAATQADVGDAPGAWRTLRAAASEAGRGLGNFNLKSLARIAILQGTLVTCKAQISRFPPFARQRRHQRRDLQSLPTWRWDILPPHWPKRIKLHRLWMLPSESIRGTATASWLWQKSPRHKPRLETPRPP